MKALPCVNCIFHCLNAAATRKFSDADFPHFMGWRLVDDDMDDDDSRCNSGVIERFLNTTSEGGPVPADTPQSRMKRLCDGEVQARLAKTICKFPTEWSKDDVELRWSWVMEKGNPYNPHPLSEAAFALMAQFAQKLCFWEELPEADRISLGKKHWHFHPRSFIVHMRKCAWLSAGEFKQLLPKQAIRKVQNQKYAWEDIRGPEKDITVNQVIANHRIPLNRMMRKYGINTPLRQSAFFGNAIQETQWLSKLHENNPSMWYFPWDGRGFLQLTHPGNYMHYWRWRGRAVPAALEKTLNSIWAAENTKSPVTRSKDALADVKFSEMTQQIVGWRDKVGPRADQLPEPELLLAPADSAGFYWVLIKMARYADQVHRLERQVVSVVDARGNAVGDKVYYRSQAFWQTSASVNLPTAVSRTNYSGINGFESRCCAYGYALAVLTEVTFHTGDEGATLDFPEGYSPRRG